jgi:DHA3 family multidrug efflux protein-like MFS transporter
VATGVIGGAFSITSAILGPIVGTYVDHHRKHRAMVLTSILSVGGLGAAAVVYSVLGADRVIRLTHPGFWVLVATTLFGATAGQMRSVPLSTCVTLLVPDGERDKANGRVGTITGLSFALTSVFSGLVIGGLGMGWAYAIGVAVTVVGLVDLLSIRFAEPEPVPVQPGEKRSHVDIAGALDAIRAVPGLGLLVLLAAFNNLLSGVFMALLDAYGLSLVSVETWGFLWGFISLSMIAGGVVVATKGLGRSPLRVIILANLANWLMCIVFPLRSSIVLLTIGMVVWLGLMPAVEAAEQTVLQRTVPFERQGRVFGFSQLVENAAAPLTAFLMAPLAERVFMPLMSDGGRGAELIGGWFGVGPQRGLALLFTLAGAIGVVVTVLARLSRSYRRLAAAP